MKKIKQYPWKSKDDFVIAFYLIAEHSGKYFLLLQQLLQEMEKQLIQPIKECLVSIMKETDTYLEGNMEQLLLQLKDAENRDFLLAANNRLKITYNEYKNFEERLSNNTQVLLNDFGDLSQGVSYYKLRKNYSRIQESLGLPKLVDDDKIETLLKKCNEERNYLHHFTEPKLLTWRQYREEQLKKAPGCVWPPKNIEIIKDRYMNILSVIETHELYYNKYNLFNLLHFCLRRDYSILIGEKRAADLLYSEREFIEDRSAWDISALGSNLFMQ